MLELFVSQPRTLAGIALVARYGREVIDRIRVDRPTFCAMTKMTGFIDPKQHCRTAVQEASWVTGCQRTVDV